VHGGNLGSSGLAGAVLAGGASLRMGRDKATLPVGGIALARLAVASVAAVADPVALVAPAGHPAAALAARTGAGERPGGGPGRAGPLPAGPPPTRPPLLVADPGQGPLAALVAALRALDAAEHVLVVGGDHPGLRVELLRHLAAERVTAAAVACRRATGVEPLVAVYERAPALALAEARVAAGTDRSLRGLLAALGARVLDEAEWRPLDPDGSSFVDLDDPGELAAWESGRWRRSPPGRW
jgi:molybdenum cofactor guanylyltransferase